MEARVERLELTEQIKFCYSDESKNISIRDTARLS